MKTPPSGKIILPKVWVTKYALTSGVLVLENVERPTEKMVTFRDGRSAVANYAHKPDWHESLAEARAQIRKMIAAKRKSIAKELEKLDALSDCLGSET